MLTRDLIPYKIAEGDRLVPGFVNPDDAKLLETAKELIAVYEEGIGMRRGELEETVDPIILAHRRTRLLKGLNKLLLDRCAFEKAEGELRDKRTLLFRRAAALLRSGENIGSWETYRKSAIETLDDPALALDCFGDLPDREPLRTFKAIGPIALLHRYNCALPQSLLLYAKQIDLHVTESRIESCRQLFGYLKFFRLMAEIRREGHDAFHITINGPLSLFSMTQKYGFQLAAFFPAIPLLSQWRLDAEIKLPGRRMLTLHLDESSGLRSHYAHFAAHVPEELRLLRHSLAHALSEMGGAWRLSDELNLIPLGSQDICIPDFTLVSKNGDRVHVELFHRWHAGALARRLKSLKEVPTPRLILGIDRFLHKKGGVKTLLDRSTYFKAHGFFFSGFPNPKHVIEQLTN